MTTERKKTLFLAGGTLIIGILIGVLTSRIFVGHFHAGHSHHRGHGKEMKKHQHVALSDRIFSAVDADSSQQRLMKPIIEQSMARHDSVGKWHRDRRSRLDSLKVKLSPILREEQKKKLDELFTRKHKPSKKVGYHPTSGTEADYWASL